MIDFDFVIGEIVSNDDTALSNGHRDIVVRLANDELIRVTSQLPFTSELEVGRGYELLLFAPAGTYTIQSLDQSADESPKDAWIGRIAMLDWHPPQGLYCEDYPEVEARQRVTLLSGNGTRTWHVIETALGHMLMLPSHMNIAHTNVTVGQLIYWRPENFFVVAYVPATHDDR